MSQPGSDTGQRVLLVAMNYAPETTGIGPYTASLAHGLAAHGFDVEVLTAPPHYPQWQVWPREQWRAEEDAEGLRVRRLASWIPERPGTVKRAAFELLYGLRFSCRPWPATEAIILLSPPLFSSAVVRARAALTRPTTPVVLWMQDRYSAGTQEILHGPLAAAGRAVKAVEGLLARSCDAVVVIHDRWAADVAGALAVPADRIAVIRNWTHVAAAGATDVAATRARLGWGAEGDEVVVLHAGNMGLKQGLENVVAAAKAAAEAGVKVRFVLLGGGTQRDRLQAEASDCRNIQFLASLPERDFVSALRSADVLLVNEKAGLRETAVPSKLTSYFAADRPVLAATESDSVTADEIRASGAGAVVAPGRPEELVRGAQELAARAAELAGRGPDYTARVLSEDAGIGAFAALLRRLSAPHRAPQAPHVERKHEGCLARH